MTKKQWNVECKFRLPTKQGASLDRGVHETSDVVKEGLLHVGKA